jgi:hypothetical protein
MHVFGAKKNGISDYLIPPRRMLDDLATGVFHRIDVDEFLQATRPDPHTFSSF